MSKLQHTPGPWGTHEFDDYTILVRAPWSAKVKPETHDGYGSYLGIHICETKHQNDNPCVSKKTAAANARLIAAAPDMLEALIFEAKISQNDICGIPIRLIKIIEKATGMSIEEILK